MTKKIIIGVTDLSFHRVTASLISHILKKAGFEVERIYASHEENFSKLQRGETDMLVSAWLPSSHGIYKKQVEQTTPLLVLGLHYEPYALWGVPDYIPVKSVASVDDLLKAEVIREMDHTIQGINPGAGITRFSLEMMEKYGLTDAGYKFLTGTEEDCFTAFERAVSNKKWIIVPLWRPQFLHYKYKIRELNEPRALLGSVDKAVMLLREDRKSIFSAEEMKILDELRFSNELIAELDYKISRENGNLDQVTEQWTETRQ